MINGDEQTQIDPPSPRSGRSPSVVAFLIGVAILAVTAPLYIHAIVIIAAWSWNLIG